MQAIRFLHSALAQALPGVHSRRLKTLMCCVNALLRGRRLTLTGLGRFLPSKAYPKHTIKRVDSEYFGVGVTRHRSHCPRRIEVLLLISALANYIICLTGLQAREAGHERRFQSNSLKRRRVLSLWRLGLEYWRSGRGSNSRKTLERLEHALRAEVHQEAQALE